MLKLKRHSNFGLNFSSEDLNNSLVTGHDGHDKFWVNKCLLKTSLLGLTWKTQLHLHICSMPEPYLFILRLCANVRRYM